MSPARSSPSLSVNELRLLVAPRATAVERSGRADAHAVQPQFGRDGDSLQVDGLQPDGFGREAKAHHVPGVSRESRIRGLPHVGQRLRLGRGRDSTVARPRGRSALRRSTRRPFASGGAATANGTGSASHATSARHAVPSRPVVVPMDLLRAGSGSRRDRIDGRRVQVAIMRAGASCDVPPTGRSRSNSRALVRSSSSPTTIRSCAPRCVRRSPCSSPSPRSSRPATPTACSRWSTAATTSISCCWTCRCPGSAMSRGFAGSASARPERRWRWSAAPRSPAWPPR